MRPGPRSARALAALALAAAPAAAGDLALSFEGGVLGGSGLDYALAGDPGELFLLVPSFTPGPTPLAPFDPLDTRALWVGLDLPGLWKSGVLGPDGAADVSFGALPANVAAHGLPLHAQALTLPGSPTIVDELSNPTAFTLSLVDSSVLAVGERAEPTDLHGATRLADGRVLLSGGVRRDPAGDVHLAALELFDPQTQTFSPSAALMQHPRARHTATRLLDGRVLLLGGVQDESGAATATGDLYDPATDACTPVAPMTTPRSLHTATVLADGRVLVVGGSLVDLPHENVLVPAGALATTELYDPVADVWAPGPPLPLGLYDHAASLLPSGRVLVSGGVEVSFLFGFPIQGHVPTCRRYDPALGDWVATAPLPSARARHAQGPAGPGDALAAGGSRFDGFATLLFLDAVTRYDEAADAWSELAPLVRPRDRASLVTSGAATLVVAGGRRGVDASVDPPLDLPALEVEAAPSDAAVWSSPTDLLLPRLHARVTSLGDGLRVLVTGVGDDGAPEADTTAETVVP